LIGYDDADVLHPLDELRLGRGRHDVELEESSRGREVHVVVVEPGHDQSTAERDHAGLRAAQPQHRLGPAHREDQVAPHGDCLCGRFAAAVHDSPVEDEIRLGLLAFLGDETRCRQREREEAESHAGILLRHRGAVSAAACAEPSGA
jgi:hypothetical protein